MPGTPIAGPHACRSGHPLRTVAMVVGLLVVTGLAACSSSATSSTATGATTTDTTGAAPSTLAAATTTLATIPATGPPTTPPATSAPASSAPPATAPAPTSTTPRPVTTRAPATTAPAPAPATTAEGTSAGANHVFPIVGKASYAHVHHDYPAADIFAACGTVVVAPVDGTIVHWRTVDQYDRAHDNPALRGGLSVAILGNDGVRYYLAHFSKLDAALGVGSAVAAGDRLGLVGETGDASACHVHFGISPNCPTTEWAVRRGELWPWPYLDAWRAGHADATPAGELATWTAAHPNACADAAAQPHAAEAG